MKPAPFEYHAPATVEEAVAVLAELGDEAKVLAGGQSLVPLMSMRLASPAHVVDINRLGELDTVDATGEQVRVGALARHARVEHDDAAHAATPLLRQALVNVAHPTIRNRGTVVGSLVHADPAAELPAVLMLLGGVVEVRDVDGIHEVPSAEFFLGPMQSALRPGQLAVAARFDSAPERTGSAFVEQSRRHGDYAVCGAGALVTRNTDGGVDSARAVLIGVGDGPALVDLAEAVTGSGADATFDAAAVGGLVDDAIDPADDIHASAAYRRHLAHVLTVRALVQAKERAA